MKQILADDRQLVALTGSNDQHGLYQMFTVKASVRNRIHNKNTVYEGVTDEFNFQYTRHDFLQAAQKEMDERLSFIPAEEQAKFPEEMRKAALYRDALKIQEQMLKRAVLVDDGERVLVRFPFDTDRVCTIHKLDNELDNELYHAGRYGEVMNNDPIFIELTPSR